jgi:hypothetical protein
VKQAARAFLALGLATVLGPSFSADFLLHGRELGSSEASACETSRIVRHQEVLAAAGITGIEFPSTECDVDVAALGGTGSIGKSRLSFWKGRMIRMVVLFQNVGHAQALAIRAALADPYGSPHPESSSGSAGVWHSGSGKLQIRWVDAAETHLAVYLVDQDGWREYERAREHASRLAITATRRRHDDTHVKTPMATR